MAVQALIHQQRVLYASPTTEQIEAFWTEVKRCLTPMIDAERIKKHENRHQVIYGAGRIRGKTAWDADTLRGDHADLLILDEFQLMKEDTWQRVGAPMMLDSDGTAVFCFTPPSKLSASRSKARDPRHANRLYQKASEDETGRWAAFHFSSMQNPYISKVALEEISADMTSVAYRQEILAEDVEEEGGLFKRNWFELIDEPPEIERKVRHWDLASVSGDGDWTVGLLLGKSFNGMYYVLDIKRCQETPYSVEELIVKTALEDGLETVISLPQDPGQAGKAQAQYLIRNLAGYNVHAEPESGSKEIRAIPVAAQAEAGNVRILKRHWTETFLDELSEFPFGWHDDQIDSLSATFADLVDDGKLIMWSV